MSNSDQRHINRDSLFVMAALRAADSSKEHRVKVRNLSDGGLMAEGDVRVVRGTKVSIELRNIGWTDGSVAWVQDNRFGIAFVEPIDARIARAPAATQNETPEYSVRRPLAVAAQAMHVDPRNLRKI